MRKSSGLIVMIAVAMALATPSLAQSDQAPEFDFKTGKFVVGADLGTVTTTGEYAFLEQDEARRFLTDFWGNPPAVAADALGLIIPTNIELTDPKSYGVIIKYDSSGYVSDSDAAEINYDELMEQLQAGAREASKERIKQGYDSLEIIGWAAKPRYDAASKKFYWAKRIRFNGSPPDTLNYEIRVLGRRGVLELNVVARVEDLQTIDAEAPTILAMVDFNQGETYREFDPKIDRVAAYGLAGLVAGGVLVKTGFFNALIKLLAPFAKVIAIAAFGAAAAVVGFVRKLFNRRA